MTDGRHAPGRRRHSSRSWTRAAMLLAAGALAALAAIPAYNQAAIWRLSFAHSLPGRLVTVSGRQMHVYCTGTGAPTVVLESGMGGSWLDWSLVQPGLSATTRVCSYDRAGMGWSEPGPKPRSGVQIASELDALLEAAGVPPPFVVVGHSVGGLHVRVFAAGHPEKVAGIVFVDASNPKEFDRLPAAIQQQIDAEFDLIGRTKILMGSGIARMMGVCDQIPPGTEAVAPFARIQACRVGRMTTIGEEYRALALDRRQATEAGGFGRIPLLILSHDPERSDPDVPEAEQASMRQLSEEMQTDLLGLSSDSRRAVVPGAGHYIQWDRPDGVVEGIRAMVASVRRPGS